MRNGRQWRQILRRLGPLEPAGLTSPHSALRDVAGRLHRRGPGGTALRTWSTRRRRTSPSAFFRHHGHEVLVFHILDPDERELPPAGDVHFFDPESRAEIQISVPDMRQEYREAVASAIDEWRAPWFPTGSTTP